MDLRGAGLIFPVSAFWGDFFQIIHFKAFSCALIFLVHRKQRDFCFAIDEQVIESKGRSLEILSAHQGRPLYQLVSYFHYRGSGKFTCNESRRAITLGMCGLWAHAAVTGLTAGGAEGLSFTFVAGLRTADSSLRCASFRMTT
jgi:hypothetical protein